MSFSQQSWGRTVIEKMALQHMLLDAKSVRDQMKQETKGRGMIGQKHESARREKEIRHAPLRPIIIRS